MPNATRELHARTFPMASPCQPQSVPAHYCHWEEGLVENCAAIPHTLSLRARQGVAIQSEIVCVMPELCDRCLWFRWIAASLLLLAMTKVEEIVRIVYWREDYSSGAACRTRAEERW